MELIVNSFHNLIMLSRFVGTTVYGMTNHGWLNIVLYPLNKLILVHGLYISWTMLPKDIVDQLLHITRRTVFTLTTCHDIPRTVIAVIHEI